YEEYIAAEDDLQKIDLITSEMDISDIDVAVRLYTKIRNKEIIFRSKVGINFFTYLSDIVASGSIAMMEENKQKEIQKAKNKKAAKKYRFAAFTCVLAAVLCAVYFGYNSYLENEQTKELARLRDMANMTGTYVQIEEGEAVSSKPDPSRIKPNKPAGETEDSSDVAQASANLTVLPEYALMHAQYPDLVGWLTIEGTAIDYPVMQSAEENGEYYLNRDFSGKKDKNGSLFMDYRNDFVNRDTNIIIYGHNMKSGAMFGTLKNYLDDDWLNSHKKITFNTIYERATYEVLGAFLSEVSYEDEYTFRYYNFLNAITDNDYEAFLANVMQLHSNGPKVLDTKFGDELLTLSTCSSYTEDGRMFIIAKKV
ncbi:MAG: class B sortase, partial [Lachnospiraceae bacterium]|nr:class B sortase [Lachnospiraceae bacterium]